MLVSGGNHASVLNGTCNLVKPPSFIEGVFLSRTNAGVIEHLARRMRERISTLELSQTDVAQAAGVSVQRLNNYLSARRMPDLPTLVRLAAALQTTTDYLLGAEETGLQLGRAALSEILLADGMAQEKIDLLLDTLEEALRILAVVPGEGDADLRSRMAARAAWHSRFGPKPN